jgi:hypothetical protein
MRRSISLFGTYTVNEEKGSHLQHRIEHLSEFRREAQERTIDKLTADESSTQSKCGGQRPCDNIARKR